MTNDGSLPFIEGQPREPRPEGATLKGMDKYVKMLNLLNHFEQVIKQFAEGMMVIEQLSTGLKGMTEDQLYDGMSKEQVEAVNTKLAAVIVLLDNTDFGLSEVFPGGSL